MNQLFGCMSGVVAALTPSQHRLTLVAGRQPREDRFDVAMLYVSDHGESLGENNLYLHGLPFAIAPDVQKRVPMVMWLSDAYQTTYGFQDACLRSKTGLSLSQDNLFHTVLAMSGVETSVRNEDLNLLNGCQK